MGTYSEVSDLLLGDIPLPSDAEKWVSDATDEIDSKLGFKYVTPITVDENVPAYRVTTLVLKRINNLLASGRLVCAKAASAELQQVHSYGASLVAQALRALDDLASGAMILPGAEFVDTEQSQFSGPLINNLDAESNVESFYAMTQQPPSVFPYPTTIWPAGSPRSPYTW